MIKQSICLLLLLFLSNTYADVDPNNSLFQQMDNQVALGISYNSNKAYNPNTSTTQRNMQTTLLNFNVEQLFNNNVWLNLNGSFVASASQSASGLSDQTIQEFGFPANLSAKAGYSFNWPSLGLQVIPYATAGHMLNYNANMILQNGFADSAYNTIGGGARLEYVFVPGASLYFDQKIEYLDDPSNNTINLSAMSYTSNLGIRYNATQKLQLALQGSFNQTNVLNNSVGYDNNNLVYQNTNQTGFGGMIMVAYLFDNDKHTSTSNDSSWTPPDNEKFAAFDNSYLLGMGFAKSTNSYSGGNLAAINSNLNYYTLAFTHLFDNGVWANVNGQLLNNLSQTNTSSSGSAAGIAPTYLGFPGSVLLNVGYAFPLKGLDLQIIPYGNVGAVGNINSYNVSTSDGLSAATAQDRYYQYGAGGRMEYNVNQYFQLYLDQLFAIMDDQSTAGLNAWSSTSKIGTKINLFSNFQINVDSFYNILTPTGSTYNPTAGINYAANQNTLGAEVSFGFRY